MAIFQEWSEYLSAKIGMDSSREIGKTRRLFSSVRIKSLMSVLVLASAMLAVVEGLQESPSTAVYFCPGICRTSKLNI